MKPVPMPENIIKKREVNKLKRDNEIAEIEKKKIEKSKVINSKKIKGKR